MVSDVPNVVTEKPGLFVREIFWIANPVVGCQIEEKKDKFNI